MVDLTPVLPLKVAGTDEPELGPVATRVTAVAVELNTICVR
jgi:hypothetical protein